MEHFTQPASGLDLRVAERLAQAANLAYSSSDKIEARTAEWGLGTFEFFDNGGTQAFLAADDETVILAFRGTEVSQLQDIVADLKFRTEEGSFGKVHRGFKDALDLVWTDVLAKLEPHQGKSLWLAGHSLGAALATLAAARLLKKGIAIDGLYTFGQPRTGNKTFAATLGERLSGKSHRFVNDIDVVPRVPPPGLWLGYRHINRLQFFDHSGRLGERPGFWSRFGSLFRRGSLGLVGVGGAAARAHAMVEYERLVREARARQG